MDKEDCGSIAAIEPFANFAIAHTQPGQAGTIQVSKSWFKIFSL